MKQNRFLYSAILYITIFALMVNLAPVGQSYAAQKKTYLVLIEQSNGDFKAYDDLTILAEDKHIMVKAKPLAKALGLGYSNTNGSKKGCILSLGNKKNIYTRNSKTYYYNGGNGSNMKKTAFYKQSLVSSYNVIHYETLNTLVYHKYFYAQSFSSYRGLGYTGIIVYSKYNKVMQLPDISKIIGLKDKGEAKEIITEPKDDSSNPTNDQSVKEYTLVPTVSDVQYGMSSSFKAIGMEYSGSITSGDILLNFSEVHKTYKNNSLPSDGIYGYGYCSTDAIIQGIDKDNRIVGEQRIADHYFLVNMPDAIKLRIKGQQYTFVQIAFSPIKPTLITESSKIPHSDIEWIYSADGYAMQYYVLGEGVEITTEGFGSLLRFNNTYINGKNLFMPFLIFAPKEELASKASYLVATKEYKSENEVVIKPVISKYPLFGKTSVNIEAHHVNSISSQEVIYNLYRVKEACQQYGLPSDGIYGCGQFNGTLSIKAIDKDGKMIGEMTTTDNVFLINFPNAEKLIIKGYDTGTLNTYFTATAPDEITLPKDISLNSVKWIHTPDGTVISYFLLKDGLDFRVEKFYQAFSYEKNHIEMGKDRSFLLNNSYVLVTLVMADIPQDIEKAIFHIFEWQIQKLIDTPTVIVYSPSNVILSTNYEDELLKLISTVKEIGGKNYFPADHFNRQVIIKSEDSGNSSGGLDGIKLEPNLFDLDSSRDYLIHLHELTHFYEASKYHYGIYVKAWVEGVAETLFRQALEQLHIKHDPDSYLKKLQLPETARKDFEYYFFNENNDDVYNVGYHFITYIQNKYGNDVVYRILNRVYQADIPTHGGAYYNKSERDKQFSDCIKAETRANVFNDFLDYYLNME